MTEECKHLDTFDPTGELDPDLRFLWCRNCGALKLPGREWLEPFQRVDHGRKRCGNPFHGFGCKAEGPYCCPRE